MQRVSLLIVVALATAASADPKPTIAVLAVDSQDPLGATFADALASALRVQSSAKSGKYQTKGTPKAIDKALVAAECKASQRACAVSIGVALGVDYVLSGELETRGPRYVLTLALVNVRSKERIRSLRDTAAKPVDARRWARTVYDRLIDGATGELIIVANAQRGDILLDGQPVGVLFEGRATISNVTLGNHALAIRAGGFRPFDIEVTVDGTTRQTVLLDAK